MDKIKIIRAFTVDKSLSFIEPIIPQLQQEYDLKILSSNGELLNKISNDYLVQVFPVDMQRRIHLIKDIKSLFQIISVFRKEKPYMVHSMTPKAGLLCMLAAWLVGVPIRVHTFTGLIWPIKKGIYRKLLMFTDWLTCRCATHIIPEGLGVMNDLQNYITNKPMKVLGYGNIKGVDMNRFSLRPEILERAEPLRDNSLFTFIFVGRIVSDKGINELIHAFSRLNINYPKIRLFIVGEYEEDLDPLKSETIAQIDANTLIYVVGAKYGDDLLAYYAASDCFVFPSYREGFPNTVLEAGAMGLPSIVTNINGSREIIEDGKNGIVIPPKDEDSLYYAMKRMVTNVDERQFFISNSRPMIESRFEQNFVQKCLLNFYHEIMV